MAEVADYLNAMDDRDKLRRVEDVLVMCLLPYARQQQGTCNDDELRRVCLEACDALDKHASTLRQALRVEAPYLRSAMMMAPLPAQLAVTESTQRSISEPEASSEDRPAPQIQSQVAPEEVDNLFG